MKSMGQSTFLIKSSKNKSFGTGFCIHKDKKGSFLLTCAHVVEECGADTLEVNGFSVELICIGSRYTIDLAVLYIEDLDSIELDLIDIRVKDDLPFYIHGFRVHLNQNHKLEKVEGIVNKCSTLYSKEETVDRYELAIDLDDSIQKGYSGSAIVSSQTEKVFAIATTRYNINHAEAIPIEYLFKVWENPPVELYKRIKKNNLFHSKYQEENQNESFLSRVFKSFLSKVLVIFKYTVVFFITMFIGILFLDITSGEAAKDFNIEGEKAYREENIEVAISNYEKALDEDIDYSMAYINLSKAYHKLDDDERAINLARHALRIETNKESGDKEIVAKAYFCLGEVYEKDNKWKMALENYSLALFSHRSMIYKKAIDKMKKKLENTKKE